MGLYPPPVTAQVCSIGRPPRWRTDDYPHKWAG